MDPGGRVILNLPPSEFPRLNPGVLLRITTKMVLWSKWSKLFRLRKCGTSSDEKWATVVRHTFRGT